MKHYIFLGLITLGLFSSTANAYETSICHGKAKKWDSNNVRLRASNVSFPSANSGYGKSLKTTVQHFNQNPSKFSFNLTFGDNSVGYKNGQNETWFTNSNIGAPAVAFTRSNCYWFFGWHNKIIETDIVFKASVPYTTSMNKNNLWEYGGGSRPFQTTAMHEMGHGAGLQHENDEYNIMGTDWTHIHVNGNSARSYLGEDAADGLVFLYGTSGNNREDLGLVHWRYSGASGAYSSHSKTRLRNCAGSLLPTVWDSGERRYRVNPGQCVRLELTAENNGKSYQLATPINYFLSTNDYISTWDTLLGSGNLSQSRANVYTFQRTLTIPEWVSSGNNYSLGAVIDPYDALFEMTETNNATYVPIRIN